MPGSPSLLRRFRSRVLPMPVAGLLLATAVAAQSPAPPPAGLRLHGLVEAVEFFSVVAPSGRSGQLTIVRIAPKGATRQEGRPRRRVRSPGAAARGDRQAGRVEAARGGHPQEAGGNQAAGRRRRHVAQDRRERPRAGAARDHQERRAAAHRRGEEHAEPPGGRGEAARSPQVDRAEARGRGRRARHPRAEAGSGRARAGPRDGDRRSAARPSPRSTASSCRGRFGSRGAAARASPRKATRSGRASRSSTSSARARCGSGSR